MRCELCVWLLEAGLRTVGVLWRIAVFGHWQRKAKSAFGTISDKVDVILTLHHCLLASVDAVKDDGASDEEGKHRLEDRGRVCAESKESHCYTVECTLLNCQLRLCSGLCGMSRGLDARCESARSNAARGRNGGASVSF